VFDLSDHALNWIIAIAEIAILLFMVWDKYGPWLIGNGRVSAQIVPQRRGILYSIWDNRVLIVAVFGLAFIAWVNFGRNNQNSQSRLATNESIAALRSERDRYKQALDAKTDDLENVRQELAVAQNPPENPASPHLVALALRREGRTKANLSAQCPLVVAEFASVAQRTRI
jgi:hypothetical protein